MYIAESEAVKVEVFLSCIKEGTLSADEYGAKSLEAAQEKWKSGGER